MRNILHCDMNNFYASVECMPDPTLREYPVAAFRLFYGAYDYMVAYRFGI